MITHYPKANAGHIFVPRLGYNHFGGVNTNTLTNVIPQILAQGLLALRQMNVMPALVNTDYGSDAREKGSSVDVPIPSAITAQNVTPANTPPDDAGVTPTKVNIPLDQWKEAPFFMSDKDLLEAQDGTVSMQVTEAVKALADVVNLYIFNLYPNIYGYVGTAGTTPFSTSTYEATQARKVLNEQLAPPSPRRFVMDPAAEANALNLRAFQDVNFGVTAADVQAGRLPMKLGFGWAMDQQVVTHTAGTASGATTDNSGYAVGATTITLASAGTGTILAGDVLTIAGDTQTYAVVTGDSDVSNGGSIVITPGLKVAIAASTTAITLKASHVVNLAFHRDAIAFATRPLEDVIPGELGGVAMAQVDPVSGLALRLEVSRQHKRTRWAFDILYGGKLVRAELATRVAG